MSCRTVLHHLLLKLSSKLLLTLTGVFEPNLWAASKVCFWKTLQQHPFTETPYLHLPAVQITPHQHAPDSACAVF